MSIALGCNGHCDLCVGRCVMITVLTMMRIEAVMEGRHCGFNPWKERVGKKTKLWMRTNHNTLLCCTLYHHSLFSCIYLAIFHLSAMFETKAIHNVVVTELWCFEKSHQRSIWSRIVRRKN